MNRNRRTYDRCIMKKLWEWANPYQQIVGYFVMMATLCGGLYTGYKFIDQAQAAIIAVGELQAFKSNTETAIAVIKQESHDTNDKVNQIYGALIGGRP